jgi:hypothetical protein
MSASAGTGARSLNGIALAANHVWGFTTGALVAAGLPVNLRTAGDYAILAKAAISTVPTSAITGNLGIYRRVDQRQAAGADGGHHRR